MSIINDVLLAAEDVRACEEYRNERANALVTARESWASEQKMPPAKVRLALAKAALETAEAKLNTALDKLLLDRLVVLLPQLGIFPQPEYAVQPNVCPGCQNDGAACAFCMDMSGEDRIA